MKYLIQLMVIVSVVLTAISCKDDDDKITFNLDTEYIDIGAGGGIKNVKIQSGGKWVASTEAPWISVSPANGIGVVDCQIKIDSTLLADEERQGYIRFVAEGYSEARTLQVTQSGFERIIQLSTTEVELPTYDDFDKRSFEIELTANVAFDIDIPADINWVKVKDYNFELDRGSRPRTVKLTFNWENNSRPWERIAEIKFIPKSEVELSQHDNLKILQEKAPLIEDNARGDSLAIVGCMRALGRSMGSNEGELMANWNFVTLWEASDEDVNPDNIGRVRSVTFHSFPGKEGIPYEIQFLTRAEEIIFEASESYLLGEFSTGSDITKLKQLKRLTIRTFGLIELDPSFVELENLEYLDISGNHFSKVPDIITPENFPKLKHLDLTASRRWAFNDLTNPPWYAQEFGDRETWGGLLGDFPVRLLYWDNLEFIGLSNNLIHGTLPAMEDFPVRYTAADLVNDTLPAILLDKPKILPRTKVFRINANFLEGEIPEWILYHPKLWLWDPMSLVYDQNEQAINLEGRNPGFSNAPINWNYYYEKYPHRKPKND